MVKEETRREEDNSCFEFSSLNRENGILFPSPRHRNFLKEKLSKQDIFDIHVCKFEIWEDFGFQRVFLLAPWNNSDIASIAFVSNKIKNEIAQQLDEHPSILIFVFKSEEFDRELINLENLIYQFHHHNMRGDRNGYFNS